MTISKELLHQTPGALGRTLNIGVGSVGPCSKGALVPVPLKEGADEEAVGQCL
jgi:hypothetical protein